ncbi:hypothetical protein JHK87_034162 [Glycine soja]|nr:hypothetical protein JHK87_034162 [Glycine soja]
MVRTAQLPVVVIENACSFLVYVSTLYIKASVFALWNTRGLNWPTSFEQHRKRTGELDLLDWLRAMFGF